MIGRCHWQQIVIGSAENQKQNNSINTEQIRFMIS